ncbi:MAG: hypothetical protein KZQ83_17215 [gamma proteobacterium symbiont of Taylorina sp.]|nr:hypothetical protein [gamma proteobacterium symbiont of Taylorina sp.]
MTGINEKGAVLISSLIFLLILTLMATTSIKVSILDETMSANIKDKNLAFQAAESALRSGESWMDAQILVPENDNYRIYALDSFDALDRSWWWPNHSNIDEDNEGIATNMQLVNKDPRYAVEQKSFIKDSLRVGHEPPAGQYIHRVTAFGVGGTENTFSLLQSTFTKRYNE